MWPFMYKESDWMLIDDDLQEKEEPTPVKTLKTRLGLKNVRIYASARTLRMKSGGVPGLTVGLRTPSW